MGGSRVTAAKLGGRFLAFRAFLALRRINRYPGFDSHPGHQSLYTPKNAVLADSPGLRPQDLLINLIESHGEIDSSATVKGNT
jgi:hypothetical protein